MDEHRADSRRPREITRVSETVLRSTNPDQSKIQAELPSPWLLIKRRHQYFRRCTAKQIAVEMG